MAFKSQLLDNKMEDESIADSMLAITVGQAKQAIKDKKFIRLIYKEHNKNAAGQLDIRLTKPEFSSFAKVYLPKMTDFEASELFNFLNAKKKDISDVISTNSANNTSAFQISDRLDLNILETHFEKYYREEDSLQAYMNLKIIKQRFVDFKLKMDVWKQREK